MDLDNTRMRLQSGSSQLYLGNNTLQLSSDSPYLNYIGFAGNGMATFGTNYGSQWMRSAAIIGYNGNSNHNAYGGIFSSLLVGGFCLNQDAYAAGSSVYCDKYTGLIATYGSGNTTNITFPANCEGGRTIFVVQGSSAGIKFISNGDDQIDRRGSSAQEMEVNVRGAIFICVYVYGIAYESTPVRGLWMITYVGAV